MGAHPVSCPSCRCNKHLSPSTANVIIIEIIRFWQEDHEVTKQNTVGELFELAIKAEGLARDLYTCIPHACFPASC